MSNGPPFHVSLAGLPGSMSLPTTGLYEVLNAFPLLASLYRGVPNTAPFEVEIVASERANRTAASGLPLEIHRSISELDHTDIIIVPSMAGDEGCEWTTGRHPEFVDWMRRMHEGGAMLCSSCSGVLVLAETGLLDGEQATIHWAFAPTFRRNFPRVDLCLNEVLITAGERHEFVMTGATSSWQDLGLYLIARLVSPTAAQAMAKFMLLDWHANGQAPYLPFAPGTSHGDAMVLRAQEWLHRNYPVASPVEEMSQNGAVSTRTFERRFKQATGYAPLDYVQRVRVEEAKRQLEGTEAPIDQISWEVGYEDPAAFRRVFKRVTRVTPGDYRRRFQMPKFA